jgi:hypothetical protein
MHLHRYTSRGIFKRYREYEHVEGPAYKGANLGRAALLYGARRHKRWKVGVSVMLLGECFVMTGNHNSSYLPLCVVRL